MTSTQKYLCTFVILITLTACATLDQGECLSANWHEIGYQDGTKGYKPERYQQHNKACQEYNIRVHTVHYHEGWEEGIQQYCSEENGWRVGLEGKSYHKSCPIHLELAFFNAFQLGRNINEKEQLLDDVNAKIDRVSDKLDDSDLSSEKRKSLRKERRRLKSDRFTAENDLERAIREARDMGFYSR